MNKSLTITWNGKSSTSLPGLMISELPPITRAAMRIDRTEIDGMDGDIEDDLGYEAYKKVVKIALTRDYDVDAIAKYFSGSGDLILSDEPERIYRASCKDTIDFAKLIRFKTAEVTFVVQPFKYLAREHPVILVIDDEEEVQVKNQGLENSKPLITIEGSGPVEITVNTQPIFEINIDAGYVTVDSEAQDAYITGVLKNNLMTGDFPTLQPGNNIIGWTGAVTKITIAPRSRWL